MDAKMENVSKKQDYSSLDKQYFLDRTTYNCPFCNRRNVVYSVAAYFYFDWSKEKKCFGYIVECSFCHKYSMHLTFNRIENIANPDVFYQQQSQNRPSFKIDDGIDDAIFYSQPTSFFTIDQRIPSTVRELISEAEGCLKMNYLTGASACLRKAIYELLVKEEVHSLATDYKGRIKALKEKYNRVPPELFDVLCGIQGMTSDQLHEQSWEEWNSGRARLVMKALLHTLHEMYVSPDEQMSRIKEIQELQVSVRDHQKERDKKS